MRMRATTALLSSPFPSNEAYQCKNKTFTTANIATNTTTIPTTMSKHGGPLDVEQKAILSGRLIFIGQQEQ